MTAALPAQLIDPATLTRYVDVVFGYLEGIVPIRMFAETGTAQKLPSVEFQAVDMVAAALTRLALQAALEGRGLYVVPGTVAAAGSARAEDVIETGVLVVDIDTGDIGAKRSHLERHLGPATLVVASGGVTAEGQEKLHLYWRLTEAARGEDLGLVRAMREKIAHKAGGDPSFGSLHQPIRVAGSVHGKNGRQRSVRILQDEGPEHDLAELAASVEAMPSMPGVSFVIDTGTDPRTKPTASALATRIIREGSVDGTTRFEALSKVIGHWIRNVRSGRCTLAAAWDAVTDHNAAMIVPPWDEGRLRREFDGLLAHDIKNNGPIQDMSDHQAGAPSHEVVPPDQSEDGLAAAFVDAHGSDWRHVAAWGVWFRWTGTHWQRDDTALVREAVRQVCRAAADRVEKAGDARRIASDKTIAAVLRIAAADPRIAARTSDWDVHPMLLNTPAGVIDLSRGELGPHDPRLLLTQITAAIPGSGCPRWLAFLGEVTGEDTELMGYLARLAGYCLTGQTTEQMFAFLHGQGGNGKSVFVQAIASALGNYASTATLDTFMASPTSRHLTELAGLRGARMVLVPETEVGRSWAEGRIKSVTGGEKVRANFMHQDHFEFTPQFKLVALGNHRPSLAGVGEAMRRRLHLVPFDVTIPPERRDRDLQARLLEERDGILGWMLEGCAEWRRIGLSPPARMTDAAAEYFESEDLIGQWIGECCTVEPSQRADSCDLFANWSALANQRGHATGSTKSLGEALRSRGFRDGKVKRGRGWFGFGLRRTAEHREDGS